LKSLEKTLNLNPGEKGLAGLLFLQYFCTGIASAFTQTTAFTLFLTEFGAVLLPWTYIAMALVISALTFLYLQVGRWLSFGGTLTLNLVGQLTITLGFAAGLALGRPQWLVFALPVLFQIAVVFGNMAFWSLAGRILNVRQGKRLFGLVGAGEWLAIVTMGFLMPFIAPLVGLSNLLWLAALGMAGAALTMTFTLRRYGHLLAVSASSESPQAAPQPPMRFWGNRYIWSILLLTVAWWVSFFFIDNIFYQAASVQYSDETALAGFLGIYLGVLGVLTLLSNFVLSGRVMGRFGLRASLLILPVGLAIGALAMSAVELAALPFWFLFAAAVATKVWSVGAGFSIDQSARSMLYQPLPPSLRTRVQTMADGVAQPIATGLAGGALLILGALYVDQSAPLILGLVVILAFLLGLAIVVGRWYVRTLLEALDRRSLRATQLILTDAKARTALHTALRSPQPGTVSYAIRVLTDADPDGLAAELPDLLSHPNTWVRRAALDSVSTLHQTGATQAVRGLLSISSEAQERAAAVRCLAALGDTEAVLAQIHAGGPLLVRAAAIAGLLAARASPEAALATHELGLIVQSEDPNDQVIAAQIIGEGFAPDSEGLIKRLLSRDVIEIRRAALIAAGKLNNPALWRCVMEALDLPATTNAAANALINGHSALPVILSEFAIPDLPIDRARLLAMICGRKRDPAAILALWNLVPSEDARLRSAALTALQTIGFRASRDDGAAIHTAIQKEIAAATAIAVSIRDIGRSQVDGLIVEGLETEFAACRSRVLSLLSLIGDASALKLASESLAGSTPDRRAYALEVIDTQTPSALRSITVPLFDAAVPERVLGPQTSAFETTTVDRLARLDVIASDETGALTGWTRACALYALKTHDKSALEALALKASGSQDAILRQVAEELMIRTKESGNQPMLSTIEKVLTLRSAGIFSETTGDILTDVAAVTNVVDHPAGKTVFEKDSLGQSMFVIASGQVGVYDGETLLSTLGAGDVFGEMALLDPEPRSATVRALDDVQLLQLDQNALFELIEIRPEVARGLLRVLTQRLRARMADLASLQGKPNTQVEND